MSKIKKVEIDRDFTADGLTGNDIQYSASQSINDKFNEIDGVEALALITKNQDDELSVRGAYTLEAGTIFSLPPAVDFYDGKFRLWVINNVSPNTVTLNAFGADTIDGVDGPVASIDIFSGESASLYVLAPAIWGLAGAVQKITPFLFPETFFESNPAFVNATDIPENVISKLSDALDGDYKVTISGEWAYSFGNRKIHASLEYDGNPIFDMDIQPSDILDLTSFSWAGIVSGVGPKLFELKCWSDTNGDISSMSNVFLILEKWEN